MQIFIDINNNLIKEKLDWAPTQPLKDGLTKTYNWVNEQVKVTA